MRRCALLAAVCMMAVLMCKPAVFAAVGYSENGVVNSEWYLDLNEVYGWGWLGVTPAIVNLPGVNTLGGEQDASLEIVTGSDGNYGHLNPEIDAGGLWRAIDSLGNVEWYKETESDESRGSVAISDLNGDGNPEIVGGTTSGHTIEVLDRFGNFVWTFPTPPRTGSFEWPTAPAVADLDPAVSGLEIVAVHRPTCTIVALDGDNAEGANDGIAFSGFDWYTWDGTEGLDWDVLWYFTMGGSDCHGSAAVGDVDNDGALEVVAGSDDGNVYVLDGRTGAPETVFTTGRVQASPALANLDDDPYLEIVIGESMGVNYEYYYDYPPDPAPYDVPGKLHVFEWNGSAAKTEWSREMGSAVFSSASIGDLDKDGAPEIVVATFDGKIHAFSSGGVPKWTYPAAGNAGPFFASASLVRTEGCGAYQVDWPMFRHDARRTGAYGMSDSALDVVIGSMDGRLYVVDGRTGDLVDRFQASGPIHGSPTVGDVDGDGLVNVVFQSWGDFAPGAFTLNDGLWNVELEKPVTTVSIDIKPGSFPNSINLKNKGVIPVAVLTTDSFDATKVDPSSVCFGDAEDPAQRDCSEAHARGHIEDVDGDGDMDLVLHFETQQTGIDSGDTTACLSGLTYTCMPIEGCDGIRTLK